MTVPAERITMRFTFSMICMGNSKWISVPSEIRKSHVRRMERSCFAEVINACTVDGTSRQFANPAFVNRYSAMCYKVLANLSAGSEFALCDRIIAGDVDPSCVASMTSQELCPAANAPERAVIERRKQAKLIEKYSTLHRCPKCGCQQAKKREAQARSADEPSTTSIKCASCEFVWRR